MGGTGGSPWTPRTPTHRGRESRVCLDLHVQNIDWKGKTRGPWVTPDEDLHSTP